MTPRARQDLGLPGVPVRAEQAARPPTPPCAVLVAARQLLGRRPRGLRLRPPSLTWRPPLVRGRHDYASVGRQARAAARRCGRHTPPVAPCWSPPAMPPATPARRSPLARRAGVDDTVAPRRRSPRGRTTGARRRRAGGAARRLRAPRSGRGSRQAVCRGAGGAVALGRAPAESLRVAADRDPAAGGARGARASAAREHARLAADLRATGECARPHRRAGAHLLWTTNSTAFYRLATSGGRGPADYAAMVLDLWTRTLLARGGTRHPIRGALAPLVALTTAVESAADPESPGEHALEHRAAKPQEESRRPCL